MENNDDNNEENGNGDGDGGTVHFKRADGVEKDGYICFPVEMEREEEVVVGEEPPDRLDMSTCPEDPRYQQTNKTNWCFRMYTDYHSCRHLLGENANQCKYFYKCYNSICPNAWIEKWDEQRAEGNFPCDPTKGCPDLNAACNDRKPCP